MTFPEVIPTLQAGESAIRQKWIDRAGAGADLHRLAISVRPDGTVTNVFGWWCTIEDLTATDWIEYIHVPRPGEHQAEQSPLKRAASKCRELADRISKHRGEKSS